MGEGRGFHVANDTFITAAHCLPTVDLEDRFVLTIPPHRASYTYERTFAKLLGRLDGEPTIAAECLFADPISDVAILGAPDGQALPEEWDRFIEFAETIAALRLSDSIGVRAWILDLDGNWRKIPLDYSASGIFEPCYRHIKERGFGFVGGMSGSPVLDADGQVIALVSTDGTCPRLPATLPRWFDPSMGAVETGNALIETDIKRLREEIRVLKLEKHGEPGEDEIRELERRLRESSDLLRQLHEDSEKKETGV